MRRVYNFLSFYYEPGDKVFVFGFSRGAFTARSAIGYIATAGLLKPGHCTPEREGIAWTFYRTRPDDRLPGTWHELQKFTHPHKQVRLRCVGVFDTVGALGVPLQRFYRFNRDRYAFHNVDLSSITEINLHALAIDEQRGPFEAAVWRKPRFKHFNTVTEQVWFAGVHADVGGGYIDEPRHEDARALDDITLNWMVRRLQHHCGEFPFDHDNTPLGSDWVQAKQHNSRGPIYRVLRAAHRSIGNVRLDPFAFLSRFRNRAVGYDRHQEPYGEMVHISALERLGQHADGAGRKGYRPINLVKAIDRIEATYSQQAGPVGAGIRLVDWQGSPMDPSNAAECEKARQLISETRIRLNA